MAVTTDSRSALFRKYFSQSRVSILLPDSSASSNVELEHEH